jgi:hypothetical protein
MIAALIAGLLHALTYLVLTLVGMAYLMEPS